MNKLVIFLSYFSKSRISEFLTHYNISHKKSGDNFINKLMEHPNFNENSLFDNILKIELQNFCESVRIPSSGNKDIVWDRISDFLEKIEIKTVDKFQAKDHPYEFLLKTIDNDDVLLRNAPRMVFVDALHFAERFDHAFFYKELSEGGTICFWKNSGEKEIIEKKGELIQKFNTKHPKVPYEICHTAFEYCSDAYEEARKLVDQYLKRFKDYHNHRSNEKPTAPFEAKFLAKYTKLRKEDCGIFDYIYIYHYVM